MQVKLVKKVKEAKDTKSFWFETERKITWLPGQYFYYTLANPKYPDPRGNTHDFTISLSQTEGNLIRFTTRMRKESMFKKSMDALPIDSVIEGEGPEGTFILDEKEPGPHVLLAGGIGITPFRVMMKYAIDKKISDKIHLIYANSTPNEIAFRKELENWDKDNKNIKVSVTVSNPDKKWNGLKGRIDASMVKKLTSNLKSPTYWLCGPPAFVDAMEKVLGQLKISPDKIRSEKFSGY